MTLCRRRRQAQLYADTALERISLTHTQYRRPAPQSLNGRPPLTLAASFRQGDVAPPVMVNAICIPRQKFGQRCPPARNGPRPDLSATGNWQVAVFAICDLAHNYGPASALMQGGVTPDHLQTCPALRHSFFFRRAAFDRTRATKLSPDPGDAPV